MCSAVAKYSNQAEKKMSNVKVFDTVGVGSSHWAYSSTLERSPNQTMAFLICMYIHTVLAQHTKCGQPFYSSNSCKPLMAEWLIATWLNVVINTLGERYTEHIPALLVSALDTSSVSDTKGRIMLFREMSVQQFLPGKVFKDVPNHLRRRRGGKACSRSEGRDMINV